MGVFSKVVRTFLRQDWLGVSRNQQQCNRVKKVSPLLSRDVCVQRIVCRLASCSGVPGEARALADRQDAAMHSPLSGVCSRAAGGKSSKVAGVQRLCRLVLALFRTMEQRSQK